MKKVLVTRSSMPQFEEYIEEIKTLKKKLNYYIKEV